MNTSNLIKPFYSLVTAGCMLFAVGCSDTAEEITPGSSEISDVEANHNNGPKNNTYYAQLNMLNESGVSGYAELVKDGGMLTVTIYATGLEADMLHVQHIHGFKNTKQNSICPPPSADTNGDGIISVAEGAPFYGDILLPLDPFTMAPGGVIQYTETFDLSEENDLTPLQNRAIVLHGLTVDGEYDPSVPVACGQVMPNNNGKKGGQKF